MVVAAFGLAVIMVSFVDGGAGGLVALVAVPFVVGLVIGAASPGFGTAFAVNVAAMAAMLGVAVFVMQEGAICLVMLSPLWLVMSLAGIAAGRGIAESTGRKADGIVPVVAACLLGASLAFDFLVPRPTDSYVVTRSVEIAAGPHAVWPHLLSMQQIDPDEGEWNFTQSVLGVPRPVSAVVAGTGAGAIRHGRWGPHVSFEEHLSGWQDRASLDWRFVFPNDTVQLYTDHRIDPDGPMLHVRTGGYRLTALPNGRTRLDLYTAYQAMTVVNPYASLWGEVMLGDIQSNILAIVRDRAEASASQPAAPEPVVLVSQRTGIPSIRSSSDTSPSDPPESAP